jgi:hypothetical protein
MTVSGMNAASDRRRLFPRVIFWRRACQLAGWASPKVFYLLGIRKSASRDKTVPAQSHLTRKRGSILSGMEGSQPAGLTFS